LHIIEGKFSSHHKISCFGNHHPEHLIPTVRRFNSIIIT
jgi:hypothetical protein